MNSVYLKFFQHRSSNEKISCYGMVVFYQTRMSKRDDTDDKLQISQNIVRIFCVSYLTAGQTIDNLSSSILSIPHRLKKYAACDLPSEFSAKTDNDV